MGNDVPDAFGTEVGDPTPAGGGGADVPAEAAASPEPDTPASQALERAEREAAGLLQAVEEIRQLAEREAESLPPAIREIFAELRGDSVATAEASGPVADEPDGKGPPEPEPTPRGAQKHEEPEPANGFPADEHAHPSAPPAPHQERAATTAPRRLLASASTVHALILLENFLVVFLCIIFWLTLSQMVSTLVAVMSEPARVEGLASAGKQPRPGSAALQPSRLAPWTPPRAGPRRPILTDPSATRKAGPSNGGPE